MSRALPYRAGATRPVLISPALLRRWPLPQPDGALGKDDRGQVLVVGGSAQIPGATILAAIAALRAGAGKLQIATAARAATAVAVALPEARVIGLPESRRGELAAGSGRQLTDELDRCDALVVGPGMLDPAAGTALVEACLARRTRPVLVVDAAPLAAFATRPRARRPLSPGVILTPHSGEMASLCGIDRDEVVANPLAIARATAARLGVIVALKGPVTYVAAPDGTAFENTAGNVGLGTSGSGDTLSGVIAGLCARGAAPLQAAAWGVYLHARAGDRLARRVGPLGFLAREILAEIPPLLASLLPSRRRTAH